MNKTVIGTIVIVVLVAIGLIIVSNRASNNTAQNTQPVASVSEITQQTSSPSSVPQGDDTVILTSSGFSPSTLTIKVGTTVTWVNKSGNAATVNSNPHPVHTDYPPLNLGGFQDGGTLSLVFNKPGTYGYHNHLNPSQKGTIIVQ